MNASRHYAAPVPEGMSIEEHAARREVGTLGRFYRHVVTYVLVNAGLASLNLATRPDRPWFLWILAGWTVWLVLHAAGMFLRGRLLGPDWEERKVRELMARH